MLLCRRVALLLVLLIPILGCNALNPLCGSSRPAPALTSISPTTITFSSLQSDLSLALTGKEFVASSVVVFNGTTVSTTVTSSTQLTADIPQSLITGPGTYTVQVKTPAGNSGNVGCSSGGTSATQTLTVN